MWNDVIIGKGDSGNTACSIGFPSKARISENPTSYWICDLILNSGMTIMKNTPEGRRLADLLKDKQSPKDVDDYLNSLLLKNLPIEIVMDKIEVSNSHYFKMGVESHMKECRQLFGITY